MNHCIGSGVINRILKNQLSLVYFMFDVSHPGLSVSSSVIWLGNVLHHTYRIIISAILLHCIVYLNKIQQLTSFYQPLL